LALLGYLKNVSPQLKPNIVLKVEDKIKSQIAFRQAETAADSVLQPKLTTSRPNNAKPLVMCRFSNLSI
jgi:hypothetical protein